MNTGWDAYAETLRRLVRAPEAAQSKRDEAADAARRKLASADAALRESVIQREAVESRMAALHQLIQNRLSGVPDEGPAESITPPRITEVAQVARAADEFERLVEAAAAGLERSRRPPPKPPVPLWWYAAGAGIVVAVIVVIAILATV